MVKRMLCVVSVICATFAFAEAQSPEFYMDMDDGSCLDGIICSIEETEDGEIEVWDVTLTNTSSEVFRPVKAGVRLGIDTYKGADSGKLLEAVGEKLAQKGYKVGNIDVTMIAQKPKLKDYIPQMEQNIAGHLGIDPSRVNVKATTEEHLGFTGEGSGMRCHAVCLLEEA